MAGLVTTETGNELSKPKFEFTGMVMIRLTMLTTWSENNFPRGSATKIYNFRGAKKTTHFMEPVK